MRGAVSVQPLFRHPAKQFGALYGHSQVPQFIVLMSRHGGSVLNYEIGMFGQHLLVVDCEAVACRQGEL
jgi:hypothetical protein